MTVTWVVAANANIAKIYALGQSKGELTLVKTLEHPEGRLKSSQIDVGFESQMHGKNSDSFEYIDAQKVELEAFAKKIAQILDAGRTHHEFSRLILVAAPRFYGLLGKELDKELAPMIHKVIEKDYTAMPVRELYEHAIEIE